MRTRIRFAEAGNHNSSPRVSGVFMPIAPPAPIVASIDPEAARESAPVVVVLVLGRMVQIFTILAKTIDFARFGPLDFRSERAALACHNSTVVKRYLGPGFSRE
jgi:hypothetical protein